MTSRRPTSNQIGFSGATPCSAGFWFRHGRSAFTLIELLVVISIIALLASLTVGLSGLATRKSKEVRLKGDLNRLVTAIESYKAAIGSYPRDNPGKPSTNQLFYELSGTYYDQNKGLFKVGSPDRPDGIGANVAMRAFNAPGFGNAVRIAKEPKLTEPLKFTEEFRSSQFKALVDPPVEILVVPVSGPRSFTYNGQVAPLPIRAPDGTVVRLADGTVVREVNPWLYDSSSPNRNNRRGFDLWTEVIIGKNVIRFSNWEKDPVPIGQTR